jgi:hypothetical protein
MSLKPKLLQSRLAAQESSEPLEQVTIGDINFATQNRQSLGPTPEPEELTAQLNAEFLKILRGKENLDLTDKVEFGQIAKQEYIASHTQVSTEKLSYREVCRPKSHPQNLC